MTETVTGASNNERLLYAARTDNEEMLLAILEEPATFDINHVDGLGNTALHLAVTNGSVINLEHILAQEGCDVDPQNRIERATPLHAALTIADNELRLHIVESLLDAGADTTLYRIKDKKGHTVLDLLGDRDEKLRKLIRKSQAMASISRDDMENDADPGSESESD